MTPNFANPYFILIVSLLCATFSLDTLADTLNLTRLKGPLPSEFEGIFEPIKYEQSLRYQRDGIYFHTFERTFFFILTLFFILVGGFNIVDLFALSSGFAEIGTGLIFIASLSILSGTFHLPFSLYDTFILEEKYGFNKTTLKTFLSDMIKGIVIGSILGGLVFAGIIFFFTTVGPLAWLYSWIALTVFQLVLAYLAPAVLMPLFNKFSPLPDGELKTAIETFAKKRNFHLKGIFTMDSSRRSTKSNAFFTGFGRFRRLVLFDTLVEKHTVEELVAVLAHEIGHFERKHIIKSMILSIVTTGVLFYLLSLFLNNALLFDAFQMRVVSVYASLIFIGFIYSPLMRIFSIFTQWISRKHEFEADAFAVETSNKPETLIAALKKLSRDNLSHLTPHPLKVALDYSHPPILQRIEALRSLE